MAETATSKATPVRQPAGIEKKMPQQQSKPEDESYKGRLAKVEKEHAGAVAKLVGEAVFQHYGRGLN